MAADEIILNPKQKLAIKYSFVRSNNKFELVENANSNVIDFINLKPDQIISIGTGLIPFLEHNDANRGLMGSNMQRQSLPLIYKENPIVLTGLGNQVAKNSEFTIIAKKSGFIKHVSAKKIVIKETIGEKINIFLTKYKTLKKKIIRKTSFLQREDKISKSFKYIKRNYFLKKERRSNQNTSISQTPIVRKNEWVKKGQLLVDNNSTYKGELAIGKNILIGYLCWEGYNFEDAIVISEKLVKNDTFTSIHIKKYKTFIINNKTGEVRIKINIEYNNS